MKNLLCIIIILIGSSGVKTLLQAQNKSVDSKQITIKGRVQEANSGESIAYATITVENDSAKIVTRQASDDAGRFTLKVERPGTYKLSFSAVGYSATQHEATVTDSETSKDLGIVKMKEGVELKEVTVAAQKPLIKSDPDKLVYSVESDPDSKTNSLLEMIRKVPLLTVDAEDNVTLSGKSNYKVLVNGKSSSLMSNNFKEVIKSMPANSIKDIEVITNPSSKYEAEGVGGIINIITVRKHNNGYQGSVGGNVSSRGGFGLNAYLSASIDKFSFSTNIYTNTYRQPKTEGTSNRENRISDEYHYYESGSSNKYSGNGNSLNFEAGYEIDTFNLISASAWGYFGREDFDNRSWNKERNIDNNPVRSYNNTYIGNKGYGYLSGNVDYQRTYPKKDKTLTASYKLDYNPDNTNYRNDVNGELNYVSYSQKSDNRSSGQTHTFQLDYFDPLTDHHQMETGVKGIFRRNSSKSEIYRMDETSADWYWDTDRVNDLDYDQYIMGIYAGYLFKIKKATFKAGARGEYTWNDGLFKSKKDTTFTNSFFNLIPYINLSYSLKPTQTIRASYTQRLYRPGIWSLNPYVNEADPLNISYGNPNLDAEIAHSFDLSYSNFAPKYNINLSLNAAITDNAVESYSFIDANGVRHTTNGNIGSNQRYGANLYASYRPNGKINAYANGNLFYNFIEANNELNINNSGATISGNVGVRCVFWKGGAISINGGGMSPRIMLQGKSSGYYYTSIGVSQKFLKDKLDIGVYMQDPFWNKIYYRSDFDDPTYTMHTENYRYGQTARLSITYRFGKMNTQVKKARRGINNDDQRGGNNSGSSEGGDN